MTSPNTMIAGVSTDRLRKIAKIEAARYSVNRPQTRDALKANSGHFLDAVPMHWMKDWPMPFPMLVTRAQGARLTDFDGHAVDDFCLGDTGSMFGHSPKPVAKAIREQAQNGLTYMLPTMAGLEAGALLSERFGDFQWQIATTASDANRYALRVARAVTGRSKIIVFNGCYHGTVDDTMVALKDGMTVTRSGLMGQVVDLAEHAIACEFNDLAGVEEALKGGDVAAILTEPVMTNSCMVLPEPGFHEGLKKLTERYQTLLIIDETHTISSGLGGYTRVHGLDPDMFVAGKCVAGGMPTAVWGLRPELARRYLAANEQREAGHSGMGTTLSANPMQFVCLAATLRDVMTAENYAIMEQGAALLEAGLNEAINRHGAPWHVVRVGARVEFICAEGRLRNGSEAALAHQPELEAVVHTCLLNRGCLIAPFHNMMLVSPMTTKTQIRRLVAAFDETLTLLFAEKNE